MYNIMWNDIPRGMIFHARVDYHVELNSTRVE